MKQETLQLTGGNSKKDRRELDFYPTPPLATVALMKFMHDKMPLFYTPCTIWEPACGNLAMSKVIESFGHTVVSTDIITGHDFLTCALPTDTVDAIITNPPFNLSAQFIERALSIAPVVAMLLKSQYWHAKKRMDLFNNNRPTWILPLTWRLDFLNGAKGGSPTMDVAWTVWCKFDRKARYQPLEKPSV